MSRLQIHKYPDKILKQKAKLVTGITAQAKKLIRDMIETMKSKNGIGLAATQVGVLKRIVVISVLDETKKIIEQAFINPVIISKKGKIYEEEGCLSFPGLYLKIKRAKYIKVKAINERGKEFELDCKDILSRVLQHEIDHLDGTTFVDRLPLFKRIKIRREINRRIKKGIM
ncbi:MAG: peptide deformylase [Elusimicrobiota bacterium]|nr:peptide deformylase [Elusimicrobiota bacterium]